VCVCVNVCTCVRVSFCVSVCRERGVEVGVARRA